MDVATLITNLTRYRQDLYMIEQGFTKSSSGYHIAPNDDAKLKQIVIEVTDLLDDSLGSNNYAGMIANHFNEGISNFTGSPSLASVRDISTVIDSAITRIEREGERILKGRAVNPGEAQPVTGQAPTHEDRKKMSFKAKFEDHPVVFGFGLIIAGFFAGIAVSEWFAERSVTPATGGGRMEAPVNPAIAKQIEVLTQKHNERLAELQAALLQAEEEASSPRHIDSNQRRYAQSAERIQESIKEENNSYKASLDQLVRITGGAAPNQSVQADQPAAGR